MNNIRKYPEWKNALINILARVEHEGYGIVISHAELLQMLKLSKPDTVPDYQAFQFKRMAQIESLKNALLKEHNLCLINDRGNGYQVLHPNDQVKVASDKHLAKARKELRKATETLSHVRVDALDRDAEETRICKMIRYQFIFDAFNRRKIPLPFKKPAQIETG